MATPVLRSDVKFVWRTNHKKGRHHLTGTHGPTGLAVTRVVPDMDFRTAVGGSLMVMKVMEDIVLELLTLAVQEMEDATHAIAPARDVAET